MLKALFYPDVDFKTLFIPHIYKEIYFDGLYVDILNQKKDLVIMDVGANIGVTVQHFQPYAKKLYAIEPAKQHFEALSKNKEFNGWDNVEVFNMALADRDGEMTLNHLEGNKTCHSLTNDYGQGGEKVKTMTFESFMKENNIDVVDFCKFDVEGAEDMILRAPGFTNVADRVKSIMIEFHHHSFPALVEHLTKLGYTPRRYPCDAVVVLFTR